MFSQLFFILLALILINFITEMHLTFWIQDAYEAFQWGLFGYAILLLIILLQTKILQFSKKRIQSLWLPLVNMEALLYLGVYHFGLGAQRFFFNGAFASYQTLFALFSLTLYFFSIGWAHFWHAYFHLNHSTKKSVKSTYQQLLFYVPFCLPFILMSIILDGFQNLPSWQTGLSAVNTDSLLFLTGFLLFTLVLIFFPALMMVCWRCKPIERFDLKSRLQSLCEALHFRHGGLKIWSIMPNSFTAGIIGIIPLFRYVLFTPALLKRFQPQELEAILVHEIGHHRYRHLLFYPFILLGMIVSGTLFLVGFEQLIHLGLEDASMEQSADFTFITSLFIFYGVWMGLYFRFVFGFFSRLFERQADLHIFASPLSPIFLIQTLDHLGVVTGYTHAHPNWHHFSLQERIRFLYQAMENPHLISLHHKKVKIWLMIYFIGLVMGCLGLYWIL